MMSYPVAACRGSKIMGGVSDAVAPTLAITLSSYAIKAGETSLITFTFSEEVLNFTVADVTAPNGTLSGLTVTGVPEVYTALFTPNVDTEDPTNVITVGTDWTDLVGNPPASSATSSNYTVDTKIPTVTLVEVQTGLTIDVTFSEAMGDGVTTALNYAVSGTGKGTLATNPTSVASVSGNKFRCTWTTGEMFNGGNITITVTGAKDLAGNEINSNGTDTGGAVGTVPTFVITCVQTSPTATTPLNFIATASEEVTGFASGDITVGGVGGAVANFATADNIVFTFDSTPSGAGAVTVDIGAGVCTDLAGNPNTAASQLSITYVSTVNPYTNNVVWSRDIPTGISESKWEEPGTNVAAYDAVGLDGEANHASTLTDNNVGAFEGVIKTIIGPADSNPVLWRVFVKKDSDVSRFPEFLLQLTGGTPYNQTPNLNTQTGAIVNRSAGAGTYSAEVNSYGDWWECIFSFLNDGNNTTSKLTIYPARGTVIGVAATAAVGSIIIGNVEEYKNLTPAALRGLDPKYTP